MILNIHWITSLHSITSHSTVSAGLRLLVRDLNCDAFKLLHVGLQNQQQQIKDKNRRIPTVALEPKINDCLYLLDLELDASSHERVGMISVEKWQF